LKKILTNIDYRGAISVEIRVDKDEKPYLIDVCSRYAFPLSIAYTLAIKNYSEVIYKIAKGEQVKIQNIGRYIVALPLNTEEGQDSYIKLDIPEKFKKYIKMRTSSAVNGNIYGVKGYQGVFLLVACADDYKKMIEFVKELSSKVSAFKISNDFSTLDKIESVIKELPQYNLGNF
ncbi:MAG: hypothetical protein ACRDFB_05625, partial [Rhabdochlamydiaceae bacterium]